MNCAVLRRPTKATLRTRKPKIWLVALIGLVGGGVLAFAAGLLRDVVDRVFRTSSQTESILGVGCIAAVQRIRNSSNAATSIKAGAAGTKVGALSRPSSDA